MSLLDGHGRPARLNYHFAAVQPPSDIGLFAPHGLQHVRRPCPPGACPDPCPLGGEKPLTNSPLDGGYLNH